MDMDSNKDFEISFKYPIRVRYADTDKMGFVYNGNYLRFFEIGRTELMRHYELVYSNLEDEGYQLPLLEAYVRYHNASVYDDLLEVETKLKINSITSKLRFDYNVLRNNELIASGFTEHLFMKVDSKRAVKPPAIFMNAVAKVKQKYFKI